MIVCMCVHPSILHSLLCLIGFATIIPDHVMGISSSELCYWLWRMYMHGWIVALLDMLCSWWCRFGSCICLNELLLVGSCIFLNELLLFQSCMCPSWIIYLFNWIIVYQIVYFINFDDMIGWVWEMTIYDTNLLDHLY